jgi:hypothetical protein
MKRVELFAFITVLFLISIFGGCTIIESPLNPTNESISINQSETSPNTPSEPTPPIEVDVSFPNGAPALNQTADLVCKVITHGSPANNMSLDIELPAGFTTVSGELSWKGTVPKGTELEVLSVTIKSVQTGNWQINIDSFLNPEENIMHGTGHYPIFVSVNENSAEWGTRPPWLSDPTAVSPTTSVNSSD